MIASVLPVALLTLFQPRPALENVPIDDQPQPPTISGIHQFLDRLESQPPMISSLHDNPNPLAEADKLVFQKQQKRIERAKSLQASISVYNPKADPNIISDPYKTAFVGRLSYTATEEDLRIAFEKYGPVRFVTIPMNSHEGEVVKPCGYAFVEFKHSHDLKDAIHNLQGTVIAGKPIVVDYERARLSSGWLPRRLGGGVGPGRTVREEERDDRRGRKVQGKSGYRREDARRRDDFRDVRGSGGRRRGGPREGRRRDDRPRDRDPRFRR
ncbi:hypothetical protein GEMRC1_004966 [Eukaryota sp. GEM-RC1]